MTTTLSAGWMRMRLSSSSRPPMSGSHTSSSARSKRWRPAARIAADASVASTTAWPEGSSSPRTRRRVTGSSSTTRIELTRPPPPARPQGTDPGGARDWGSYSARAETVKTVRSVNIALVIPLSDIRAAALRIAGEVHRTPIFGSRTLGERAGVQLSLKCESLQKTGSFKPRGALNIVLSLPEAKRARGLVTVSAGNHAQAVAWVARTVGVPCTVVMPADAPRSKTEAVRGYGATIVAHADRTTLFDRLHEE